MIKINLLLFRKYKVFVLILFQVLGRNLLQWQKKCLDTLENRQLSLAAISTSVGFYNLLGFEIDWEQYEIDENDEADKLKKNQISNKFEIYINRKRSINEDESILYLILG